MATYKTESHKSSNSMKNKSDRMSYSLKNKVKSSKSDYASDNLLDLNMSIDNINDRTDTIIKASEKITNKQIADTARFYKESAKAYDDYLTHVDRTSSKSNSFYSPNSSSGVKTGASNSTSVTPSYSGRSLFSDTSVSSLSNKFSKSLDNHAKSFEKSSRFLKESILGLTSAVAGFATYASTQVLNRYNSYAQLTGSKDQTQSLYDTFARSNKELVNELNSTGHNTVSVDEFSKMNSMVAQYFKTDQKMIGDMSKSMVLASEAGMSVNSEFLRTSAYIYKQSGKNEKSIRRMTDQVYDTATKANGVSLSDVQNMMMDSAKLSQNLAGQASQKGISFDADKFISNDTKAKSALKEVSSQYGDEAYSTYNKVQNILSKEIITDPKDAQLLQALGIDYGEGRKRLLNGDSSLSGDILKKMVSASKSLTVGEQQAILGDSNLTSAFGTTSESDIDTIMNRQNSDKRTTKDSITSRKADWISSISNSFKEASIDTMPPMLAQATQYLGTITGVVTSMGFLNLIGGGRGGLGALKSGFSALSKSGLGQKGASFLSGSGKLGGLLKGVGGKALGVAGVGFTAYDAFNGATSDADRRFGKDANLGNRASSMLGSALGGSGEGGLGSALSGAGKGAAIGAFLGPVGAAVGAGIGGIFGAIGGDKIAKTFSDNIADPLGKIGNSLQNKGKDLISSVGDLAGGVFKTGGDLVKGLGDTLGEIPLIGGALKGVTDLAGGLATGVGDVISGTGNWIQDKFDGFVNFFTGDKSSKAKDGSEGRGMPAFSGAPGHQVAGGDPSGPKPWTITATYGPNGYGPGNPHSGIDYGVPRGTNIVSTTGGTVYDTVANDGSNWRAFGSDGPGQGVIVQGDDGLLHMYWHLSKIGVTKGQKIKKGNSIGLSGNTGMSTGPHLHYEVDKNAPYSPNDINPSSTASGLWGASTSSVTSSDSAEEKVETNVITLSDSRRAKLSYAGSPGAGIRNRLGARGVGVGALPPTSNVSFNSDNTDVVSTLRSTMTQLSNKLDMIADILIQTAPKEKTDDFRLTT